MFICFKSASREAGKTPPSWMGLFWGEFVYFSRQQNLSVPRQGALQPCLSLWKRRASFSTRCQDGDGRLSGRQAHPVLSPTQTAGGKSTPSAKLIPSSESEEEEGAASAQPAPEAAASGDARRVPQVLSTRKHVPSVQAARVLLS